ncbi:rhodanese-like domain-containing protein [Priestia megaterium]|uniref:rhodanese-like domain-containing protein n=1 Tax=Priestia TaxID=2800373 RepID=UPI00196A4FF9|nr:MULTISPECIES: rhodanese-like domain-containing protein [Priestia]MED3820206.1 rhodanese-like domain-containing protein [Priestia aryabhattai]MED4021138.1 rhodanese-like domain-containing protein [Priestia aryabhattai]QSF35133.1 rhodanese-like domain-containing protein [Priestia megaterium]WKG32676.1 rhodanese-like domain-containing protein [Priestia aryabhattai]
MKTIAAQEVEQLVKKQEQIHILDVREVEEVKIGKISNALNIPLPLLEFRMHELDKTNNYIVVCRSGGRSGMAARFLEQQGYSVTNMTGGMMEWKGETV